MTSSSRGVPATTEPARDYSSGYVVLEFNQASGMPSLYGDDVHDNLGYARAVRDDAQADASRRGRRERYGVYELTEVDDDE